MSYSRWLDTDWYTYWQSSDAKRKEDELLSVWYSIEDYNTFTYIEIEEIVADRELFKKINGYNDEEDYEFLKGIFKQFLQDVRTEYSQS